MMGFFDKVKKAFGSKKEDVESRNSVNDEVIDEPTFTESIENEKNQSEDSKETPANIELINNPTPNEKNRNFRYLDGLIHSGVKEIVLDSDLVLGDDEESQYLNGIKLDVDDLIIDGDGHTIDAKAKTRIFYCIGRNIAVKNITLKNGFAQDDGGAVRNDGELTITDSTFIENTAIGSIRVKIGYGGAISNYKGDLSIISSTFLKNTLRGDGVGGAIGNYNGELSISGSTFSENSATSGGAIYTTGSELSIVGYTFYRNTENEGISNAKSKLSITDSIFMENTAKEGDGGAIFNTGSELDIENSRFIKNTANGTRKAENGYGGAIYTTMGELNIAGCEFTENTAMRNGGSIRNMHGKLSIIDSSFTQNTSKLRGGGAIENAEGELSITSSVFTDNVADRGGAINNSGKLTITDSTLNNNTTQWGGGAINNGGGEMAITDSTLNNNTSEDDGGAINNNKGKLTVTSSTLNNNTAQGRVSSGGAIFNKDAELSITESILNENTAKRNGAAIYNEKGNFKIFKCKFSTNKSPNNIILNNDFLQIHNTTFKNNQSKDIVLNDGDEANLSIFNGDFIDNDVEESVLGNNGRFCSVEKTVFQNNISNDTINIINNGELTLTDPKIKDSGKSILNENYILIRKSSSELENKIYGEGSVEIDENIIPEEDNFDFRYLDEKIHESNTREIFLDHDITFENYERDFYEGGIELDIDNLIIDGNGKTINGTEKSRIFIISGKNITLKNIVFKNGHSYKNYDNPLNSTGGAIKINSDVNITIENCEFINNISEEYGGAIDNTRGSELIIMGSTFTENVAQEDDGGAIYNGKGKLTITESTLSENIAEKNGGAIRNHNGELSITDSTFTQNSAKYGGVIHNLEGELTVTGSAFSKNTASYGGAIRNDEGELSITDSEFSENSAETWGGAIENSGEFTITDSAFTENTASDGGAINNLGDLTITDSIFTQNTATRGGAISNTRGGELRITRSVFTENATLYDGYGGAIYNVISELNITDSEFRQNTADMWGGAIYNKEGDSLSSLGSIFGANGAIHDKESDLIINSSVFSQNTLKYGKDGEILLNKSRKLEFNNCVFKDNKPDDVNEEKD